MISNLWRTRLPLINSCMGCNRRSDEYCGSIENRCPRNRRCSGSCCPPKEDCCPLHPVESFPGRALPTFSYVIPQLAARHLGIAYLETRRARKAPSANTSRTSHRASCGYLPCAPLSQTRGLRSLCVEKLVL
ncbi:hypothetical protein B0H12DRAFT_280346 [Mycena haematopus]|nr:hypothetical protein B0H12DRAFT_280346 [Mycena haematopus]